MTKTARDIMTTPAHTIAPETTLEDLVRAFGEKGVSGFPVVNAEGRLVGVVTEADLLHQNQRLHIPTTFVLLDTVISLGSSKKLEEEMRRMTATTVGGIMTPDAITVEADAPLEEVARKVGEEHVHTLPVVDPDGRVVGVVGKLDVIRALLGS